MGLVERIRWSWDALAGIAHDSGGRLAWQMGGTALLLALVGFAILAVAIDTGRRLRGEYRRGFDAGRASRDG